LQNYKIEIKQDGKIDTATTLDKFYSEILKTETQSDWNIKKQWYYKTYIQKEIGSKKVSAITELHIKKILAKMENDGLKPRTRKAILEVLKPIFRDARKAKICKEDPTEFLKVKVTDQKKFVINASEKFDNLYRAVLEVYNNDAFMRALFLFALFGRRKGELLTIKWENIDFKANIYWLLSDDTKPDQNQQFKLTPDIKTALLEFQQPSGLVFASPVTGDKMQNLSRQVKKIRDASGVSEWGLHYSRNVIVSMLHERGVETSHLSGILGHTDANTITKYLSINTLKGSEVGNQSISELLAGR
jgi:integrase